MSSQEEAGGNKGTGLGTLTQAEAIQRISAQSRDSKFETFDKYPWRSDAAFQSLLVKILNKTGVVKQAPGRLNDGIILTRVKYYDTRVGVKIDTSDYHTWLAEKKRQPPTVLHPNTANTLGLPTQSTAPQNSAAEGSTSNSSEVDTSTSISSTNSQAETRRTSTSSTSNITEGVQKLTVDSEATQNAVDSSMPAWMRTAPRSELYVEKKDIPGTSSTDTAATTEGEQPYPSAFAEIVQALMSGQEIPGIREIPDDVVTDPNISVRGKMQAPPKPWEQAAAAAARLESSLNDGTMPIGKGEDKEPETA